MNPYEMDEYSSGRRGAKLIADEQHARLVASLERGGVGLPRRAARPLGRGLLRVGEWLLRYGRAERATLPQAQHHR